MVAIHKTTLILPIAYFIVVSGFLIWHGTWFSIVYFGEHYVFDIVIGALYAVIIFGLVVKKDILWGKLSVHVVRTKISS